MKMDSDSKIKRIFLVVLDSFGIGELPDAAQYGDTGSNTLGALLKSGMLCVPELSKLGLFHIDGANQKQGLPPAIGSFARLAEMSSGKDTTTGHWEISGVISKNPMPTYPNGFPKDVIAAFSKMTGCKVICNKPYSGTKVILDYGEEHLKTGALIVYTSADSVFQIAAHEDIVPIETLYRYCKQARELLHGEHAVGRVIARPFTGENKNFKRTVRRHDFSLIPPSETICDRLQKHGLSTIGVGKIYDIFAGRGISETFPTFNNAEGLKIVKELLQKDFNGLAFINLVDFDMQFGHRNDVMGYTLAMNAFDLELRSIREGMNSDDVLIITADHGCDPSTPSTDHSREYVPFLIFGDAIKQNLNLGTRNSFSDLGETILDMLSIPKLGVGQSMKSSLLGIDV